MKIHDFPLCGGENVEENAYFPSLMFFFINFQNHPRAYLSPIVNPSSWILNQENFSCLHVPYLQRDLIVTRWGDLKTLPSPQECMYHIPYWRALSWIESILRKSMPLETFATLIIQGDPQLCWQDGQVLQLLRILLRAGQCQLHVHQTWQVVCLQHIFAFKAINFLVTMPGPLSFTNEV